MSKTIGNVIHPDDLINKYGVDGTRYVLLAAFPFGEDGDVSWETFDRLFNADLANGLGNLVARVAKLCQTQNVIASEAKQSQDFDPNMTKFLKEFKFNEALNHIWGEISEADKKVNEEKPWELSSEKVKPILEDLVKRIKHIGFNLQPFLPERPSLRYPDDGERSHG